MVAKRKAMIFIIWGDREFWPASGHHITKANDLDDAKRIINQDLTHHRIMIIDGTVVKGFNEEPKQGE